MKRRDFIRHCAWMAGSTTLLGSCIKPDVGHAKDIPVAKNGPKPPNIIYVMLDELGYYELSLMGNSKIQTPNIDRMASEGMLFTQAYAC